MIGDIIHDFILTSLRLTLFALFFIFRHYSLFFQKYENNVIISLQISKLWLFSQLFLWNPIFLKERLAHKALGLLPTAQSVFERDMGSQGSFTLCFSILQQCLTLYCRETLKCNTFCCKTLKYVTFCCENLDSSLIPFRHYFWEKDIIHQKIDIISQSLKSQPCSFHWNEPSKANPHQILPIFRGEYF